jgi:hypothetical protein
MLKYLRFRLLLFVLLGWVKPFAYANHIVGGELQMKPAGASNTYEITLIQFWDQNNLIVPTPDNGGNRDVMAYLYIYQKAISVTKPPSSSTISAQNKSPTRTGLRKQPLTEHFHWLL